MLNGDLRRLSFDSDVPIASYAGGWIENDDVTQHQNIEKVPQRREIDFFRGG